MESGLTTMSAEECRAVGVPVLDLELGVSSARPWSAVACLAIPGAEKLGKKLGLCRGSSEAVANPARFMCGRAIKPVRPPGGTIELFKVKSFRACYLRRVIRPVAT